LTQYSAENHPKSHSISVNKQRVTRIAEIAVIAVIAVIARDRKSKTSDWFDAAHG